MGESWDRKIPAFPADAKGMSTRDASGKVLNGIAEQVRWVGIGLPLDESSESERQITAHPEQVGILRERPPVHVDPPHLLVGFGEDRHPARRVNDLDRIGLLHDARDARRQAHGLQGCCEDFIARVSVAKATGCPTDLVAYCGCDGKTFRQSGSCPGNRYQRKGPCPGDSAFGP